MSEYFIKIKNFLYRYPSLFFWGIIYIIVDRNYLGCFIAEIPFDTHEWAQGDRCAIAQAFYYYGNALWDPSTLNLEPFRGKVGVELPLIAFIAGHIGRWFGPELIYSSFRILNFIICALGSWHIFKLIIKHTKSVPLALLGSLFMFISFNFLFYACNFLSDAPAASLILIGFCYFTAWVDDRKNKDLFVFCTCLTIASLLKLTTSSYTLAMISFAFYLLWKDRQYKKTILILLPIGLIFLQVIWIKYRIHLYPSKIFLSSTVHFNNWDSTREVLGVMRYYFQEHYMPLSISILWLSSTFALLSLTSEKLTTKFFENLNYFKSLFYTMFGLVFIVFLLFGRQFKDHDYYFISTWSPLLFITWAYSLIYFHKKYSIGHKKPILVGLFIFFLISYTLVEHKFFRHIRDFQPSIHFTKWSDKGSRYYGLDLMKKLNISEKDSIIVMNDGTPNLSLSRFNRKGYSLDYKKVEFPLDTLLKKIKATNIKTIFLNKEDYIKEQNRYDLLFKTRYAKDKLIVLDLK